MTIKYYTDMEQGSESWFEARRGLLTASEMNRVITIARIQEDEKHRNNPNKKVDYLKVPKAEEDKLSAHVYELAAQRTTKYTEPTFIGDDMLRGNENELRAKIKYNETYAALDDCGFITNDKWGFTLGYSPDARVRGGGVIECKSRRQKYQFGTIANYEMPEEYIIQVQTGLLVSEEPWCDFVTYCGGMHMLTMRILPDEAIQKAILTAATAFHEKLNIALKSYHETLALPTARLIPTERVIEKEMFV